MLRYQRIHIPALAAAIAGSALWAAAAGAAAPGSHDTSFGTNGFSFLGLVRQEPGSDTAERWAEGAAIVRQPGGRLVAAVTFSNPYPSAGHWVSTRTTVGLARVTSSGKKDRAFGHNGEAMTDVAGASNERATSLVRQSSGHLVLAGTSRGRMLVVRYTASGRQDRSFGSGGTVVVSPGAGTDVANDLRPRGGGRILLAGQSGKRGALVQLRADGRLDREFGHGGTVLLDLGPGVDRLTGVKIDRQGRIVVSGTDGLTAVLARLSACGVLDRGFGSHGVARVAEAGGRALVLDSHGRTLLAGVNYRGREPDRAGRPAPHGLMVARFTPRGKLDRKFGAGGITRLVTFSPRGVGVGAPSAIVLDPAGRALISGTAGSCASVARITTAGGLDTTFGPGDPTAVELPAVYPIGYVCPSATQILEQPLGDGGVSFFSGLLLQPDRRIVAVGAMGGDEPNQWPDAILARYYD